MIKAVLCSLLMFVCAIVVSAPEARAQQAEAPKQPKVYTYVSFFGVPRTDWARYEISLGQERKAFDGLVADGTIVGFGAAALEVHEGPNAPTHVAWFSSSSVSGLMKALAALRTAAPTAPDTNYTMHSDAITMSTMYGGKAGSAEGGYLVVQDWTPKPGHSTEFIDLVTKYRKPGLDVAVANGTLSGYSLDQELIHTDAPGSYQLIATLPNAAALDKFYEEIDSLHAKQPLFGEVYDSVVDASAHRDHILRVLYSVRK